MNETMMALGDYRFSVDTAAYQELKRSQAYRWQPQERLLRRPAQQFLGPSEETLELTGVIYPHYRGGLLQLALLLVDGLGFIWGRWVITHLEETQSIFQGNGRPLKQGFRLQLTHYGEDDD
jgi:phage protein U